MCDHRLIVDKWWGPPDSYDPIPHYLEMSIDKSMVKLLGGIRMTGVLNYAAAHEIHGMHGVKHGYMFVVGEMEVIENNVPVRPTGG